MIPIYILLGTSGSGRREIILDLIETGLGSTPSRTTSAVYISENEWPALCDERLHALPRTAILSWRLEKSHRIVAEPHPADTTALFFLTEGGANPVDQIEVLKSWTEEKRFKLARIFTVVHCQLGYAHPELQPWFEACIHFSDMVLLNKLSNVPFKWSKDFQQHFKKNCYPCLFEYVENGTLPNPAHALYPEPRRLSLIFDDLEYESTMRNAIWGEDNGELEGDTPTDPYLQKLLNGHRAKPIPDIGEYLEFKQT